MLRVPGNLPHVERPADITPDTASVVEVTERLIAESRALIVDVTDQLSLDEIENTADSS
jgi:hypothetical protein